MRTLTYNRLAVPVHEHLLRTTDLLAPPDRRPRYRRPSWVPLTLHRSHEIACPLLPHNVVSLQGGFHHPTGCFP